MGVSYIRVMCMLISTSYIRVVDETMHHHMRKLLALIIMYHLLILVIAIGLATKVWMTIPNLKCDWKCEKPRTSSGNRMR